MHGGYDITSAMTQLSSLAGFTQLALHIALASGTSLFPDGITWRCHFGVVISVLFCRLFLISAPPTIPVLVSPEILFVSLLNV